MSASVHIVPVRSKVSYGHKAEVDLNNYEVNFESILTHAKQNAAGNAHKLWRRNRDQYHQLSDRCTGKVRLR